MRQYRELRIKDKKYKLIFTVRSLAEMENLLGSPLFAIIAAAAMLPPEQRINLISIKFVWAGLQAGLVDMPEKFDAYDFIDKFCNAGGNLGDLSAEVIQAIIDSGIFTVGVPGKIKRPEMKAPVKESNPSINGVNTLKN